MAASILSLSESRSQAGAKAKAYGALFEQMFAIACRKQGIALTRIPDSCKQLGASKMVRVKSPFDWICSYKGKAALFDTKTLCVDSFPHSKICSNQVLELVKHEEAGNIAGYIIWFRKADRVIFVHASNLETRSRLSGAIKLDQDSYIENIGTGTFFDVTRIFHFGQ